MVTDGTSTLRRAAVAAAVLLTVAVLGFVTFRSGPAAGEVDADGRHTVTGQDHQSGP